jgi:hypothetical protein
MKPDHLCRVGKGARAESFRLSCELDRARRAHAVGCQWWARRAKRAFAHLTIQFERDAQKRDPDWQNGPSDERREVETSRVITGYQ